MMNQEDEALLELGRALKDAGYRFVTVTPESHRRVNARRGTEQAHSLRDVFGWSRPFRAEVLPPQLLKLCVRAGVIDGRGEHMISTIRASTIGDVLYFHSAYPTLAADSVFFGPDTYRYVRLLEQLQPTARRAVDVGCGSGAGGLSIARGVERLTLSDVNPLALRYAQVNANLARLCSVEIVQSDVLEQVDGPVDLVIANPPYLVDDSRRRYRDGGGAYGEALSVRIVRDGLRRLAPGGCLILYTAAAISDGEDCFYSAIRGDLTRFGCRVDYRELDPDVFGEELERDAYRRIDRLAVVALIATKP